MNLKIDTEFMPKAELWILHLFCHDDSLSSERIQKIHSRMPKSVRLEKPIDEILFEAVERRLLSIHDSEKNKIYKTTEHFDALKSKILEACQNGREAWRTMLLNHVCDYVEIPDGHGIRNALMRFDRRDFMPPGREYLADYDLPVVIKEDMTESALHAVLMSIVPIDPKPGDHILVCGAKGGMLGCLLAELVGPKGNVTLLDWDKEIIHHVGASIKRAKYLSKIPDLIENEDITVGLPSGAPWNAIIMNGTIPKIPYDLIHQLDDEDGRLIFFFADKNASSQCLYIRKNKSILIEERLSRFRYTQIPGKYGFDDLSKLQQQYQESRDDITKQLVKNIQDNVHYPVSRSFISAYNARDPHERHMRILKVGECLIKYLAVVSLSEIQGNSDIPFEDDKRLRFSETLHKLAGKAPNGIWLDALRQSMVMGQEMRLSSLIRKDWEKSWKNQDIVSAQELLVNMTTREKNTSLRQVRLKDLLSKLMEYRNKTGEGHGQVNSLSQAESISNILIKAFGQLLPELSIFKHSELLCLHNLERKGEKDYVFASRLSGSSPMSQRYPVPEESIMEWHRLSGHVVLTDPAHRKILSEMHPWVIWTDMGSNKDNECYLFNSSQSGNYDYITYHNPSVYPDPMIHEAFDRVLSKFPEATAMQAPTEIFQSIIRGLLGVFLSDMKIQPNEMKALVQETIRHGVAKSEEDAEKWIRNLIDNEYPGVYYGEG